MKRKLFARIILAMAIISSIAFSASAKIYFDDIDNQTITQGLGTFEFQFRLLKDISKDPHNHPLILATAGDATESYKIEIIETQLIVWREFDCFRNVVVWPYNFRLGEWHTLKLAWNKESTAFYVDGHEIPKYGLYAVSDLPYLVPCIRLGHEDNFEIKDFQAKVGSSVAVDPADRDFVKNTVRLDLKGLLKETPQETFKGVALIHFPGQAERDKIKYYIGLMPPDFISAIKKVIFVEDRRFLKGGQGAFASSDSLSIVLKGSCYDDPTVFFHEAAHLYDYKQQINFGVPNEQSEWAAISGGSCYYGGGNITEFESNFQKSKTANGFLAEQGGQCPSEDLAIWVGAAYENYLKKTTFATMLDPKSPQYSPKSRTKLDFILRKGFINKNLYDQVTAGK
jgi:hypothetical protein